MRLVLFEIEDVLVSTHGSGLAAIVRCLEEVYGIHIKTERTFLDGKTDPEVAHTLLRKAGVGYELIDAGLKRWADALPQALKAVLPEHPSEPCPGVLELLAELSVRKDVLLGLVTGSLENTTPIKLAAAGLDTNLFRVGAYGSDDADRKVLLATAVMRAEQLLDRILMREEIVLVGATPAELTTARAYGTCALGIATGRYTPAELRRQHPTEVLHDLTDLEKVLALILA